MGLAVVFALTGCNFGQDYRTAPDDSDSSTLTVPSGGTVDMTLSISATSPSFPDLEALRMENGYNVEQYGTYKITVTGGDANFANSTMVLIFEAGGQTLRNSVEADGSGHFSLSLKGNWYDSKSSVTSSSYGGTLTVGALNGGGADVTVSTTASLYVSNVSTYSIDSGAAITVTQTP